MLYRQSSKWGKNSECSFLIVSWLPSLPAKWSCCFLSPLEVPEPNKEWFCVVRLPTDHPSLEYNFSPLSSISLFSGTFPSAFTQVQVPPILKNKNKKRKISLGLISSSSYYSISSSPSKPQTSCLHSLFPCLMPHAFLISSRQGFYILTSQLHEN